jgi:hypothetical protein
MKMQLGSTPVNQTASFNYTKNIEKVHRIYIILGSSQFVGSERRT